MLIGVDRFPFTGNCTKNALTSFRLRGDEDFEVIVCHGQ